jgi:hypothetical protein
MITVNLRPGQKRKRVGSNPFKGLLDSFRDLGTKVKDPLLLGAVGAWVIVVAFLGLVYLNSVRQLYTLEPRLEQARSENRRFRRSWPTNGVRKRSGIRCWPRSSSSERSTAIDTSGRTCWTR